ncbi:MAG: DEAD/DEAH box helicase, partial [Bacteriovoracaceae bacterium]
MSINSGTTWDSPLEQLAGKSKPSASLLKLRDAGYKRLKELLWILPLRIQTAPSLKPFSEMREGELFLGKGKLVNASFAPAYGRKGKGRVQLFNATLIVQDSLSQEAATLKFFNTYPNFRNSLEDKDSFAFMGQVQQYKGTRQIVNPKLDPKEVGDSRGMLVEYPTVATVSGKHVKGILEKIPADLWEQELDLFKTELALPLKSNSLIHNFAILHGKKPSSAKQRKEALNDLIYCEFFEAQMKVLARRQGVKEQEAPIVSWDDKFFNGLLNRFSYDLTQDQENVLKQIKEDFQSGRPMMRMTQGDVGCGKTTVAFLAAMMTVNNQGQVALMCPTESLALQHFETFKELLPESAKAQILLGSSKASDKKKVCAGLASGAIDIVIGTHSLIQDSVEFKNLQFVIIDEQHKFGVEQRQKLAHKNPGVHSLIMTATPIPRTLQLAQYGDLDISTIRSMP